MSGFCLYVTLYREESAGQISEVRRLAEEKGMAFLLNSELPEYSEMTVCDGKAVVPGGIVLCERRNNPDLIMSVRTALAMGAEGIIIRIGNNPNRDYILDKRAYTFRDALSAYGEVKRLRPLFK